MLLILMRHGIAVDEGRESDAADARRALTPQGEDRVRAMAQALGRLNCRPDYYFSSHRVRARDTARLVAECFGGGQVEELGPLDFSGEWEEFVAEVAQRTRDNPGAVVLAAGHQPNMGEFVTQALAGSPRGFRMKKAAMAALSWPGAIRRDGADLEFYLTHGAVRRLQEID